MTRALSASSGTTRRSSSLVLAVLLILGVSVSCTLLSTSASAHETPIALLELRETQPGTFAVDWTYSSSTNMQAPTAVYPDHCALERNRLICGETGLYGELELLRLGLSYSAAVVRLTRLQADTQSFTLTGATPTIRLTHDGKLPVSQVIASYVPLGFEHILLGIDHLLFVLGLMLLVQTPWTLVKTITAFTVAHSLTLGAATFGWIGVPETAVNAAIALSIVVVGVEVLRSRGGDVSWSAQYPWAVAFGFGLLHGLGFATALTDIGLPAANIPAALLFFNIGVELGQLGFVLLVLALVAAHRSLAAVLPRWTETVGIYAMGALASFWFWDRFVNIIAPPVIL